MREPPRAADRAISELIGMVLLIALVLLGSTTIVVLGAGALSDAQEQTQTEAAEDHLRTQFARIGVDSADVEIEVENADTKAGSAGTGAENVDTGGETGR